ncbi:transcription antitermination factor NusB [Methylonatrum kenyense]|uniref:transcription antitermination factor NusB n=1 Tax=Methylonatrum kenyense TaxID=455253 RepID=UPI0020C079A7|nr:transcription antitermination factor NusB [Methylonatrum kenyense]MCK8517308.1 transcription antitermination factor NusB [Methylonatrum kenyense]
MTEQDRRRKRHMPGAQQQARQRARQRALQALYQWQLGGLSASDIERQFLPPEEDMPAADKEPPAIEPDTELEDATSMDQVDVALFRELLHGVLERLEDWDARITPHLSRSIASLDPVERLILRMGTYELVERLQVPARVVINECVELAKQFGGQDGHKYINAVLDKVARNDRFRQTEIAARDKGRG